MEPARQPPPTALTIEVVERLCDVPAPAWNALVDGGRHPFMSHELLEALEATDCLERQSWHPQHLIARDGESIVAVMPLYLRGNSYGEFVFDWTWADAYERAGGRYYPKLVNAVPFSPVSGPRVAATDPAIARALLEHATRLCDRNDLSSLHQLFPPSEGAELAVDAGLELRLGLQYQWFNDGYADFDDFLSRLTSKHRKEIRRERRKAAEAGLTLRTLRGLAIEPEHWDAYYAFYCDTFHKKWGSPRLTREFFSELAARLGDRVMLEMAFDGETPVAGAFLVAGDDTLFGRHWGGSEDYRFLHFELCYYRPIDLCIREGLARFDAGAQGEHKLKRGFVPVLTSSTHHINNADFRRAVARFLADEREAVLAYHGDLCREGTVFNAASLPAALALAPAPPRGAS